MEIIIGPVDNQNLSVAMKLIEEVFDEFVAPDYSEQGIKSFKENFIYDKKFLAKFAEGTETMYGAYYKEEIVGCLSISIHNTISCIFVKREYHRKGIASMLLNTVIEELKKRGAVAIKLNASPYAMPFYYAMGFKNAGDTGNYNGIIYTPMELDLI